MPRRRLARICCAILAGMSLVTAGQLTSAEAANAAYGTCQSVALPVSLAAGQPANQTVTGLYCQPTTWAGGTHEVDALTEGATYNRAYWDWPQNPGLYSYADKTLQAGRAVFEYDRIGTGTASHPLSTSITVQSDAYVLHQVVGWLHGQGIGQVNSVGHSYGSIIALLEAGTYRDVSRLVVTGLLHIPNSGIAKLIDITKPAVFDPHFAGQNLDLGYLTTLPDSRSVFYNSSADPAVIAYDNDHPDAVSSTAVASAVTVVETPALLNVSNTVTAPVVVVTGAADAFFCTPPQIVDCGDANAVRAYEAPYFRSAASLSAIAIANTGHDLTLHPSADTSFAAINSWIATH
jgi:pimeloyl-ACP methyl ester carboxylesterase